LPELFCPVEFSLYAGHVFEDALQDARITPSNRLKAKIMVRTFIVYGYDETP
jgi:hypothetical protein